MDKRIQQLDAITTINSGDYLVVAISGTSSAYRTNLLDIFRNDRYGVTKVINANYTGTSVDNYILCETSSSPCWVLMPNPTGLYGKVLTVKDWKGTSASNQIQITGVSGSLGTGPWRIDGGLGLFINTNYGFKSLMSDGSGWVQVN